MSLRTALLLPIVGLSACAQQDDAFPHANPGPLLSGQVGQTFEFDGSASIADTWAWSLQSVPLDSKLGPADLLYADSPWPLLVPDVEGRYTLLLRVCLTDGLCDERSVSAVLAAPTRLAAEVELALNDPGFDEDPLDLANLGSHPMLHDDDPVEFHTHFGFLRKGKKTPGVRFGAAQTAEQATDLLGEAAYEADPLQLEALQANWGLHDHDPVEFRSKFGFIQHKGNHAPVAIAQQSLGSAGTVTLDGTESYDLDGDSLRYRWTFASIPAASRLDSSALRYASTDTAEFTPDVPGVWVLRLAVNDGSERGSATVMVELH